MSARDFIPLPPGHTRLPRETAAAHRRWRLVLALPCLALLLGAGSLLIALDPGPRPADMPVRALPAGPDITVAALAWEETAAQQAPLFPVPGWRGAGPQRALPNPDTPALAATALQEPVLRPVPPLYQPAPPRSLEHALDIQEFKLLNREQGMLATWARQPLTRDGDFETPFLDGTVPVESVLAQLQRGLTAGTPFMDEVEAWQFAPIWEAPARPEMYSLEPSLPARVMPEIDVPARRDPQALAARMEEARFHSFRAPPAEVEATRQDVQQGQQQAQQDSTRFRRWLESVWPRED